MSETTTEQLAEIEGQATEYTPPEGWRVVRFGELLLPGDEIVQSDDGRRYPTHRIGDAVGPNQQYIRRIKPEPQAESHTEQQIEELRSEVSYVQKLLGESRQRVTHLEDLVGSLRTINEAQEKAFTAAGQDNTALRNQLAAVKAEVVQERLERNRWHNQVLRVTAELDEKTTQCEILQIELDAAQQVPADSPELRQLRADLEQVTLERDQYLDSYQRIFGDLETIRETTKAAAVEAIAEWLEPIRAVDNEHLANETLQHLPQIMRHLTGLTQD